jgi:hypothetical protein
MMMIITTTIIIIICIKISQTSHEHKVTKLWNQQVPARRTTPNNKPDITRVIRDNKQGTCVITDIAIPEDRIVINKEAEKVLKYTTEIQRI